MPFCNVKKKLGFGCMRLPKSGERIDRDAFCRLIDRFMEEGFNYFDTARIYHGGDSECALRECLVARYPRESFVLTDKLTSTLFEKEEDIRPLFFDQLRTLGTDYLDFYLMHAQSAKNYDKYQRARAYETAFELKREGKIRHVGISFHDSPELLDRILTDHPEVEVVQIQFNYVDYNDPVVMSYGCYEVCRKHGKPIIVMEPVKGGALVNLPKEAKDVLLSLGGGSIASYAIRFAASYPGVEMVLSGMSNDWQLEDNLSYMKDFRPLDQQEHAAVEEAARIFRRADLIRCTACRYCIDGCPKGILIPDLIAALNAHKKGEDGAKDMALRAIEKGGAPSSCIGCEACERECPQSLPVSDHIEAAAKTFGI